MRDHRIRRPSRPFATVYKPPPRCWWPEVAEALGQLSGPTTKRVLWRMSATRASSA